MVTEFVYLNPKYSFVLYSKFQNSSSSCSWRAKSRQKCLCNGDGKCFKPSENLVYQVSTSDNRRRSINQDRLQLFVPSLKLSWLQNQILRNWTTLSDRRSVLVCWSLNTSLISIFNHFHLNCCLLLRSRAHFCEFLLEMRKNQIYSKIQQIQGNPRAHFVVCRLPSLPAAMFTETGFIAFLPRAHLLAIYTKFSSSHFESISNLSINLARSMTLFTILQYMAAISFPSESFISQYD